MTPERWARVKTVFDAALDWPAEQRPARLASACAGDAELLGEVGALLQAHDTAGNFLAEPAAIDPEDADVFVPGSQLDEHYQIDDVLGRGGMGIVYLAHDYRLGRRVALKALSPAVAASPDMRERLRREARIAATIRHPAVATVYALEEIDGNLYIASEYVPGHTLASEIARGPIPLQRTLGIAREVAAALEAAHQAGVVHRDLKPDNILIDEAGVKIVDFGIAHIEGPEAARLTRAGALLGTPAYMAPEQLLGGPVDPRTDVYAFGVILSEMLTGRHPAQAPLDAAAPVAVAAVVNGCMEPDPAARYSSGTRLLAAIEAAIGPAGPPLRAIDESFSNSERDLQAATPVDPPPSSRFWWEFHQAAAAVVYAAMVYAGWLARGALEAPWGRIVFVLVLATAIVSITLRLHLWFTSRWYPDQLAWARGRNAPWLLACDWLFALTLLAAGLAIGDTAVGVTLIAVGIGVAAAFLVIEPVTTKGAFRN